jgi:hypothetical protein
VTTGLSLLGCTDWRAGLGIHRTQAGRIGSSPGRGPRAEARRSTTTPAIYSVTSATDPAAVRPGGATRVAGLGPARVRLHRHRPRPPVRARARCATATAPGPPERARARCPAEDYSTSSGEPASVTAPGRRSAPGPVPGRAGARPGGPVASNCAARGGSTGASLGPPDGPDRRTAQPPVGWTPCARLPRGGSSSGPVASRRDRRSGPCSARPGGPAGVRSAGRSPDCHAGQDSRAGLGPR